MEKRKSMASDSDKMYVVIQARVIEGNICRIQGSGPETNRDYGVALNVASDTLANFLKACSDEVPESIQ